MDISFHYFAVKTVAFAAGFSEAEAQRIAEFSQFIDDFNWYTLRAAKDIPSCITSNPALDIVYNKTLHLINPVTTGFSDWFDMATLVTDRSQKFTVAPFHFIPKDKTNVDESDFRTVPADLDDGSYISNMLARLRRDIAEEGTFTQDSLMRMGMLMHTFADTYAHQLFSGYNESCNSVKLNSVFNNITQEDESEKYAFWVNEWILKIEKILKTKLPAIGHMVIAHVPDLTHISFEMEYQDRSGAKRVHARSNISTFAVVCQKLYRYMRMVLGEEVPARADWDDLAVRLSAGFLFDAAEVLEKGEKEAVPALIRHWSVVFPEYSYSYDSEAIKKRFVQSASAADSEELIAVVDGREANGLIYRFTDEFYKFNLFADQHLIELYGPSPR